MSNITVRWDEPALKAIRRRAMQGLILTANDVTTMARGRAPVLTGNLKSSIRTNPHAKSWEVDVVAGGNIGGARVEYAYLREFKNRKHPDTVGYMRKSLESVMRGDWIKNFRNIV